MQDGVRIRLVALGVLVCDDDLELVAERGEAVERECDRTVPLRGDDPESPALALEPR